MLVIFFVCAAESYQLPPLVIQAPNEMGVAEQAKVIVHLRSPIDQDLKGRLILKTTGDNRAALFSSGGREAEFQIAAMSTKATFAGEDLYIQSGAGVGEIVLKATFTLEGEVSEVAEAVIQVPSVAPAIDVTGIRVRAVNGQPITLDTRQFEVTIPGVAPDRGIASAEFRFRPSRPGSLVRTDISVDLSAQFRDYFQANPGRTDFTLVMPFTVEGSLLDIAGASVTLVNSAGERSNEASADSEIIP